MTRQFRQLAPCGYIPPLRLSGPVGGTPDITLLNVTEPCRRRTLPPFLSELTFETAPTWAYPNGGALRNFYHLGDFLVASSEMKDFLEQNSGAVFEAARIHAGDAVGADAGDYWAMKVQTRIECIDPERSFASPRPWSEQPMQPFSALRSAVPLAGDVAPWFANAEDRRTYVSYPHTGVGRVTLNEAAVPSDIRLFEPLWWPGQLIIERNFADELEGKCRGSTGGYYFFTIALDDVDANYRKEMTAMR